MIGQLAKALYSDFTPLFYFTIACTGVILILAANTAFNGFPVLGSILARDGYLPRQLDTRGDRLAFSNGIILLAVGAIVLIQAFDAEVTRLIQLYIVGVFVSFTLSQTGMIRHWNRHLQDREGPRPSARGCSARGSINTIGLGMTATVLVIVLITKFLAGAWIAIARDGRAVPADEGHRAALRAGLRRAGHRRLRRHAAVARARGRARRQDPQADDARAGVRAGVAAQHARGADVEFDPGETAALHEASGSELRDPGAAEGHQLALPRARAPGRPLRQGDPQGSPRDVVTVYIPEYVVGRWWEQLLHNQTALRLKGRLLFMPGVMVTSVPTSCARAGRARSGWPQPSGAR